MGTTPQASIRYPELTDVPNVPTDMAELATDLDSIVIPRYASTTARDAAITAPVEGQVCYVSATGLKTLQVYYDAAWRAVGPRPYFVRKSADESLAGSVILQDDNDLLLALPANTSWQIDLIGLYNSPASADFQFSFTVPSGASGMYIFDRYTGGTWQGSAGASWTANSAIDGSDVSDLHFALHGVIHITTGGDLKFKWAQNGPASGTMVVRANSYMKATRVA